ncbi:putative redox protein [Chitinophaga rupis]|uniref:Putative redox protein n=2 Tax=Chitinophaga TaxID=79328 RepID=A0A1H7TCA1_9BACT|nr:MULTISPECIES: OsmC family protein [Chitinophaga]SEL82139.1 putative redox protein [Chitinophaga rupis]
MKISLKRIDDGFNMEATDENGHSVLMDSSVENGGNNNGVRPMQMLIMGLGGCSAIDVVMILKKQRQEITDFRIEIEAEREKGKEPSIWETAKIVFYLDGKVDPDKAARAVELSMNKYCSVAETLRRSGTNLTWETRVNQA